MRGKNASALTSPNRFRALGLRTGASPSCLRVSHEPLPLSTYPFGSPREAEAAAFRRAHSGAFHPATDHPTRVPISCKVILEKWFLTKDCAGAYRVGCGWRAPSPSPIGRRSLMRSPLACRPPILATSSRADPRARCRDGRLIAAGGVEEGGSVDFDSQSVEPRQFSEVFFKTRSPRQGPLPPIPLSRR